MFFFKSPGSSKQPLNKKKRKIDVILFLLGDVRFEGLERSSLFTGEVGCNLFLFGNTLVVGDKEGVALSVDPFLWEERNDEKNGEGK